MAASGGRLTGMDKRSLTERDICTKFITMAVGTGFGEERSSLPRLDSKETCM